MASTDQPSVAAGGDGTISAAAAVAFEAGVPLGVVPAGTMNLFARSLAIPMTMRGAAEALTSPAPIHIDTARAMLPGRR